MARRGLTGQSKAGHGRKRVLVVVLGDLGRSPRMQYHSLSLAQQVGAPDTCPGTGLTRPLIPTLALLQAGLAVDILAQGGSRPLQELTSSPHICVHALPDTCAPGSLAQAGPCICCAYCKRA